MHINFKLLILLIKRNFYILIVIIFFDRITRYISAIMLDQNDEILKQQFFKRLIIFDENALLKQHKIYFRQFKRKRNQIQKFERLFKREIERLFERDERIYFIELQIFINFSSKSLKTNQTIIMMTIILNISNTLNK